MASTHQLAVGVKGKLPELKSRWLKFNHDNGYQVKVSQNVSGPKARYFSMCYSAPTTGWKNCDSGCRAHIKAVEDTREDMTITSLNVQHTCSSADSRRKRNYRTSDIQEVSGVLQIYQPTTSGDGNAKQFMAMTKSALVSQLNLAKRLWQSVPRATIQLNVKWGSTSGFHRSS